MGFYDDDRNLYALVVSLCFVLFAASFVLSWVFFGRVSPVFQKLPLAEKADWCSRFNSTIHGVVVVIGFVATLCKTQWQMSTLEPYPSQDLTNVRCFMAVALGYFAFDFIVIVGFRVPLFPVFIVHHIVASIPYYLHLFVWQCDFATLSLASFLCVELATVFLNAQSWYFTVNGTRDATLYRIMFWMTYVSWLTSRIGLPVFCMTIFYQHILLGDPGRAKPMGCVVPIAICGHIIALFCTVVFLGVLTPEAIKILRGQDKEHHHHRRRSSAAREPIDDSAPPDVVAMRDDVGGDARKDDGQTGTGGDGSDYGKSGEDEAPALGDISPEIRSSIAAHA